mmetsp:Transcript_4190/g.11970  ORF Transcript_4190/g.11970 Transcript_4190/m.11970 type:complete len:256 (+) Transcript_4190:544-1311(+)
MDARQVAVVRCGRGDPGSRRLHRDGAVLDLVVELAALVLDPVRHDDGRDEAQARVGRVDAHRVEPLQHKLQPPAQRPRPLLHAPRSRHRRLRLAPLARRLLLAPHRLRALHHLDERGDEPRAALPRVEPLVHLPSDELEVHKLAHVPRLLRPHHLAQPVANLSKHTDHTCVAWRREPQVVDQAVPEGSVERLADARQHGVVAHPVQLEPGVQQQLVRQLLVGHAPRQHRLRASAAARRRRGLRSAFGGGVARAAL